MIYPVSTSSFYSSEITCSSFNLASFKVYNYFQLTYQYAVYNNNIVTFFSSQSTFIGTYWLGGEKKWYVFKGNI